METRATNAAIFYVFFFLCNFGIVNCIVATAVITSDVVTCIRESFYLISPVQYLSDSHHSYKTERMVDQTQGDTTLFSIRTLVIFKTSNLVLFFSPTE